MLLIGKPSISMGHLYHGYVSHNQRVIDPAKLHLANRPNRPVYPVKLVKFPTLKDTLQGKLTTR